MGLPSAIGVAGVHRQPSGNGPSRLSVCLLEGHTNEDGRMMGSLLD